MTSRAVILHGHFYQPPREDPWLDEIPHETSAAPFRNWNERIESECYRAVVAARLPNSEGRIASVINTLAHISYDVGATLLTWLEREAPSTYAAIVEADRASRQRLGFGNAIAAPFHHVILPLCSRRDKITEVRWGMIDFRRRFGREPEGFWLPETAVDDETLDVIAAEGIRYTMLAPHQVEGAPSDGSPGVYRTGSGDIAIYAYHGPLSHDVAFGPSLADAVAWERQIVDATTRALTLLATDGETFGHHHRFGEMALAALLTRLERRPDVTVTNPAAYLAAHPPHVAVRLRPPVPSSWSCAHGVERWRAACGCRIGPAGTSQAWRTGLREGLDVLAQHVHARFADANLFDDPWEARDAYGVVATEGPAAVPPFVASWVRDAAQHQEAIELLEMERDALRMFTSCGWFFDDVAGLESRQVLRYAARATELAGLMGSDAERSALSHLETAISNDGAAGSAADLYLADRRTEPRAMAQAAAAWALARAVELDPAHAVPSSFSVDGTDASVTVEHRLSSRRRLFTVSIEGRGSGLAVTLLDGDASWRVALGDLPDRARDAVTLTLTRRLTASTLTTAQRDELAAGAPPQSVIGPALCDAVRQLQAEPSTARLARVEHLVELSALRRLAIPYEVQTQFAALRERLPAPLAAELSELLGFA